MAWVGLAAARGGAAPLAITNVIHNGAELLAINVGGQTYARDRLVGGIINTYQAGNSASVFVQNGAPPPATGTRAGLLADFLLDTGVINPAATPTAAGITFARPVVNGPGPELFFFDIHNRTALEPMQVRINGLVLTVTSEQWGLIGYSVNSADIWRTRNPANTANVAVTSLAELEAAPLVLANSNINHFVYAVGLDLSDFGLAEGAAISSFTYGGSGSAYIDPVEIAGVAGEAPQTGGPVISEFLADNQDGLEDEDLDHPDWIEVCNGSGSVANLAGWFLTDEETNLVKWAFPARTVEPYACLVVFASGKNRTNGATLHTNFRLAKAGGYLALVKPDGTNIATEIRYDPQAEDVSFGWLGPNWTPGYLQAPSPGALNTGPQAEGPPAADARFDPPGGIITNPVTVVILAPLESNAVVRYTTDFSEPTANSPIYTNPFTVSGSATIRARVFAPGHLPGDIANCHFIRLGGNVQNYRGRGQAFHSTLPVLLLESFGVNVDATTDPNSARPFRLTYAALFDTNQQGVAALDAPPSFLGRGGTHVRGQSSANFLQKSYAWELWRDSQDVDRDASLLGMPADSDWILYGPFNDKALFRNLLVYQAMFELNGPGSAARGRLVEVFFNQNDATLDYEDYRGVYVLMEKLKRGEGRIAIQKLNDSVTDTNLITGGYLFAKDKGPFSAAFTVSSSAAWGSQTFDVHEPDAPNAAQLNYLRGYMAAFDTALNSASFTNPLTGYAPHIEPRTFMDNHLFVEIMRQEDGYRLSTYYTKDRGGKVRALPIWDYNLSLGNTADRDPSGQRLYAGQEAAEGWYYQRLVDFNQPYNYPYYPRLFQDPEFVQAYWDRYWQLRRGWFATSNVLARIDRLVSQLAGDRPEWVGNGVGTWPDNAPNVENPAGRHFARWQNLGHYDWPNPAGYADRRTYADEVNLVKRWLAQRLDWIDSQSLATLAVSVPQPPEFGPASGFVAVEAGVAITNPNPAGGDVFYTMDGPDPRQPGGAADPAAAMAEASVTTATDLLPFGSVWRFLAPATAPTGWKEESFNDAGWSLAVSPRDWTNYATTYFRTTFNFPDPAICDTVVLDLLADDGAVVYLNGLEVGRVGLPFPPTVITHETRATTYIDGAREAEFITIVVPTAALRAGANTLAVEVHQYTYPSGMTPAYDLNFDARVRGLTRTPGVPLTLPPGLHTLRCRVRNGADWSPLAEATFAVGAMPASSNNLVISEIMYDAPGPTATEQAAGFNSGNDFEFLELLNIGASSVDLRQVRFADGISFDFANARPETLVLPAGERVLVVDNRAAFELRYGTNHSQRIAGEYGGNLAEEGESLTLLAADGSVIQSFAYHVAAPWPTTPGGLGATLVLADPASNPSPSVATNWRGSPCCLGSPGTGDPPACDTDGDGLPDEWEMACGTNPITPDAEADPDDDGLTNAQELAGGTHPRDPASPLRLRLTADQETLALRFLPGTNLSFTIQYRNDLISGEWLDLTNVPAAPTNQEICFPTFRPDGPSNCFYRVRVP